MVWRRAVSPRPQGRFRRNVQGAVTASAYYSYFCYFCNFRFSLSHDEQGSTTSDNLEAISEAASNHSVASSLEDEVTPTSTYLTTLYLPSYFSWTPRTPWTPSLTTCLTWSQRTCPAGARPTCPAEILLLVRCSSIFLTLEKFQVTEGEEPQGGRMLVPDDPPGPEEQEPGMRRRKGRSILWPGDLMGEEGREGAQYGGRKNPEPDMEEKFGR